MKSTLAWMGEGIQEAIIEHGFEKKADSTDKRQVGALSFKKHKNGIMLRQNIEWDNDHEELT